MDIESCTKIIAETMPGREDQCFGPISIGSSPVSADEGARLILDGIKTATSSPFWEFPDGKIPYKGALSVLLDGRGEARAIVETSSVDIVPFNQVSEEFAFAYGEGDRSMTWFRSKIGDWYRSYAASSGNPFTEDTPVICERITVVAVLPSSDGNSSEN
ncbi:ASCH domain-containing protein [Endobacterium cereale]|nr:ASCH domain-containing protein [Endobacterium cereale]MEB2846508.1 ASCH domain-containing protein [Endobacterium cereale]